jgi:hypothetical protein
MILSQDNLSPSRDLNRRSPEYETGMLTTRRQRSVTLYENDYFVIIRGHSSDRCLDVVSKNPNCE